MFFCSTILAAKEGDPMKIVMFLIFAAIWALTAIVSAIGKKKEKEKRERVRRELEGTTRRGPDWEQVANQPPPHTVNRQSLPPLPPGAQHPQRHEQRVPVPPSVKERQQQERIKRRLEQQRQQQQQKAAKPPQLPRRKPQAPPPPPVPVQVEEVRPARVQREAASSASKPATRKVAAADLRTWLSPATMRQQFIVTEILQPPLAMRPPRD